MGGMLTSARSYLQTRIDPHTIWVSGHWVAADAQRLLQADLAWGALYDRGRLLADVSHSDLLASGHHDSVREWLTASQQTDSPLYRSLTGGQVEVAEHNTLSLYERIDLWAAHCACGREPVSQQFDALADAATTDLEQAHLRRIHCRLRGVGLPAQPSVPSTELPRPISIDHALLTDDHAGCVDLFNADVRRAAERGADRREWVELARVCRFLTGDDARAMAFLEAQRFHDVRDAWVAVFGDVGHARVQAEKAKVLSGIETAFDGIAFPGPSCLSLYQAEARDNGLECDTSMDHTGRWQDLPREHILDCQWALPHLGSGSLPYYLPALMSFAVREHDLDRADHHSRWVFEAVLHHVACQENIDVNLPHEEQRHRVLTPRQLAAIGRFAEYYVEDPSAARWWRRLAER